MNTELFDLAAKFRSADDAHAAAEAAYIEAGKAMKAAHGARNEARDRLAKAIGKGNAIVVNGECFISDGNFIETYKIAGWIGWDLAKPDQAKADTVDADGFIVWNGGENPAPGKRVRLKLSEDGIAIIGAGPHGVVSENCFWGRGKPGWADIIAYKVVG